MKFEVGGSHNNLYVSWEEDLERSNKDALDTFSFVKDIENSAFEAHKLSIFGLLFQGFCCMQCQLSWKKSNNNVQ